MMRWRTIAVGRLALLLSTSAHASLTVPDYDKELRQTRASTFRVYVERQHFSLRLELDGERHITVRKAIFGPHSQADMRCEEAPLDGGFNFLAQSKFDLYFVEQCLSSEMPALNIDSIYDQALREIQERLDALDLTSRYDFTPPELIGLEPWAQSYLSRLLVKDGLPDLLLGAWKRHALSRSECYEAKRREFSSLRDRNNQTPCKRWERIVGATRFCGPDPANLIFYTPQLQNSDEQRVVASLEDLGLPTCLGNLLSQAADPRMIDALESFGYAPSLVQQERANEYAWKIWRSFQVDEWLDRTLREGAVPKDVESALDDCARGTRRTGATGSRVVAPSDGQRRIPPPGWAPWQWEQQDASSPEALLEHRRSQLLQYAGRYWATDVSVGADGHPHVVISVNGPRDDEDMFCQPAPRKDVGDFLATARLDLPIVLNCLRVEFPALDVDTLHRTAAAETESRLIDASRRSAPEGRPLDLLVLQRTADSQVADALDRGGIYDFLAAAVRTYIGTDSQCYRDATSNFEARRRAFFAQGGKCETPERLIGLMPSMKPDLPNYVVFDLYSTAAGPFHDPVKRLEEVGLRGCLGQILEQAGDRDTMEKFGMLQQYSSEFQYDPAVRYAWELWREHGIEEWIQRTSKAGSVPRRVRRVIRKCAAGKIPESVRAAPDSNQHLATQ